MKSVLRIHIILLAFFVIALILVSPIYAMSIGAAPASVVAGELTKDGRTVVYPGKDYAIEYYIISNIPEKIMLDFYYVDPHNDIYSDERSTNYPFDADKASQEPIGDWIEFTEDPMLLLPGVRTHVVLPTGRTVTYSEKINIVLHVPKDAEPGYHVGTLGMTPLFEFSGGAAGGMSTLAITRVYFSFYVEDEDAEPLRLGEISSIQAERGNGVVRFDVLFYNKGTDTVLASVSNLKVYDDSGGNTYDFVSGSRYVKPKEMVVFPLYSYDKKIRGDYKAEATVSYITGHATKESQLTIPDVITIEETEKVENIFTVYTFPWVLVIILIALALIIYYTQPTEYWDILLAIIAVVILLIIIFYLKAVMFAFVDIPWWFIVVPLALVLLYIYWKW